MRQDRRGGVTQPLRVGRTSQLAREPQAAFGPREPLPAVPRIIALPCLASNEVALSDSGDSDHRPVGRARAVVWAAVVRVG